jgi:aryl sulfotransferase
MAQTIVWLASYPKSGNTWLRAWLTNYWQDTGTPADINALLGGPIASDGQVFDREVGVEASDLTAEEIERYRPGVYRRLAAQHTKTLFMKVHDAYTRTSTGDPLFPADVTQGAIYLMRNPLDVVVDPIVTQMASATAFFWAAPTRLPAQLRQRALTWSGHVCSWVDGADFPVHVMRYEDMVLHPRETLTTVIRFLGLPDDAMRLHNALTFSAFNCLQAQERTKRFAECASTATLFFRQGRIGAWREVLTDTQVHRVLSDHGMVMQRFGYLTPAGDILY